MGDSMAKVKVAIFDGQGDFSMWKKRMLAHLSILGLKDSLEESIPDPKPMKKEEDPDVYQERLKEDEVKRLERAEKAMNMLILNLGDHVLRKLDDCTTAAAIWTALERLYNQKTLPNRIHLQHKFYTFKMVESKSVDQNIDDFLKLVSGLSSLSVEVTEEVQAILLLNSLPAQYNSLKETLKYGRDTLTIESVMNAAKSKELELGEKQELNASAKSGDALVARGRSEKRESSNKKWKGRSRSSSGSRITCWYCKKEGHKKADCYARKKKLEGEENAEAAVVIDALTVSDSWHQEKWVIDSGCSYHMTSRRDWFDTFEEVTSGRVALGDDSTVDVQGVGSVKIKVYGGTVKVLNNVRYVPKLKRNLLSTGTLDRLGFDHAGGKGKTRFYKDGKLALQGTLSGSLYLLDGETVVAGESNNVQVKKSSDETDLWHRRLGHMSLKNLQILARKGILDKRKISEMSFCENCVMGKHKKLSFQIGKHNTGETLKYIHADLWGSQNVTPSISKKQYFLSIIDDYTRKTWVYFLAAKSDAFVSFCEWKKLVENQVNKKVKCLRTDNGLEFCNKDFDSFCRGQGIERHRTCAYTPQQNGVAERMNRTIMEKVRCLLNESGLEEEFWAEAVSIAVYQINRSPSSAIDYNIPEELWLEKKPGYKHMRSFGSLAYVHTDQGKLKPRSVKGVFLSYPVGVKGYKVWLLEEKKCVISRNVIFVEDKVYKDEVKLSSEKEFPKAMGTRSSVLVDTEAGDKGEVSKLIVSPEDQEVESDSEEGDSSGTTTDTHGDYNIARDRPRREIIPPARYGDYDLAAFALIAAIEVSQDEPRDYQEAIRSRDKELWNEGMDEEMSSLEANKTWKLVETPKDRKVIGCKWVYRKKPGIPGVEKPRHKSRLVAKGYSQKEGIDYQEVFSHVVKHVSIRLLLAITVNEDLELEQLDVKTAFLHGVIEEEIFMEQPEGYVVKEKESLVCKLEKALYGLKQAPRQWNKCFDQFVVDQGFMRSEFDHCVYIKESKKGVRIYLLLYVDDMLLASKDKEEVSSVKKLLASRFEMKDLGPARRILGMDIVRNRKGGVLTLSQSGYIKKVLQAFNMDEAKSVTTPIGAQFRLSAIKDGDGQEPVGDDVPYSNAIGSVMYAMLGTRCDVAYVVGLISRFMSNPSSEHWLAVKWVLRYLKKTESLKLVFRKQKEFKVEGFCDSDFSSDLDRRRSISGYVFTAGGSAISWRSGLQDVVALSTTEAEYMAMVEAVKEGVWLKGLTEEFGYKQRSIDVWCDSQSALCLAKNNVHHERTKHISRKMHFIRDIIALGDVRVLKIATEKNPADMLTKVLPVEKFEKALSFLGVASH